MSKCNISRRNFIKLLGASGLMTTTGLTVGLTSCRPKSTSTTNESTPEAETNKMIYRIQPKSGDKISLLGYGCMRWPTVSGTSGENLVIDQETVNKLVDYAIEHGVNYFDVSPVYLEWKSETATGIALSRHPRDSYFLASKMSNHHLARKGLTGQAFTDASKEMYHNSFKVLQTDHLDYYLMHNIGTTGGWSLFQQRFLDSGILDFLLEERAAGHIRNLGFSFHGEIKTFEYMMEHNDKIQLDFAQIKMNYVDYRHATGWDTNAEYLYGELTKNNIPVVVMEPLMGGKLASLPESLEAKMKERRPNDSPATWAFRFAGSFPHVMTVLSGMTYMEHLQSNLQTYSPLEPCSQEELDFLEEIATEYAEIREKVMAKKG